LREIPRDVRPRDALRTALSVHAAGLRIGWRPDLPPWSGATGIELEPDLVPATVALEPMAGWTAHVLEQAVANRLIRPDARYERPVERDVSA
jgi:hypothetical protein